MLRILQWIVFVGIFSGISAAAEGDDLFEKEIRPVLATRCISCHGVDRQDGDLRLDAREHFDADVLARRVSAPVSCRLKPNEDASFEQWIAAGMPWPETVKFGSAKDHWAFQPVVEPVVPTMPNTATSIDAFVLTKLQDAGLTPATAADRQTLIRRLSYTLTGVPPRPEEVDAFINDPNSDAYEKLVERLLDSDQYGEHWARHWLDVARYSDTKGYIYGREERFWTHAWAYRDWVVRALNEDQPFDQFLLLQLAADQLVDNEASEDLAAMGFLTLGRRFLGVERDIVDDRIDVVTRGTMGLTVGCARCHDHKYDPIPTADYYSLYGVFASSRERLTPVGDLNAGGDAFQAELKKRRDALQAKFVELRAASSKRARERIADYLFAQTELEKYPANGFDQIFSTKDLLPSFVHGWNEYLRRAEMNNDPVFAPWISYAQSGEIDLDGAHPLVAAAFKTPPISIRDVADRYGKLFAEVDQPEPHDDPLREELRQILYKPGSPAAVPNLPIVHSETFFPSGEVTALWKLEGEIYRWLIKQPAEAPHALILEDRDLPADPRVFIRGNPLNKGDDVPRQFLGILSGPDRKPFQKGSGRLEMALAIVDPSNPLTARVIVNRVWGHHFGQELVTTPSDFGVRAQPPSHPQLLDWLASRFVAEGWSLKKLHRRILLSDAYRRSSSKPGSAREIQIDPENRLLWRMNPRRLSWEQFRDSMFFAGDDLDLKLGGKPVNLFDTPHSKRRTIYGLVDRQFLPVLLRTFDFANPDLHIPKRAETTVPQQALFFMNHPLVLERARTLATFADRSALTPEGKIRFMMRQAWQRTPSSEEVSEGLTLIQSLEDIGIEDPPKSAADWQYGYGVYDEAQERVTAFEVLPHFTGEAWQGGEKWPDAKLGWVQLTADGGHPGNNLQHAAIRRWTAPRAMRIRIQSRLIHEHEVGDGIRGFVVSSRSGKLANAEVHKQSIELNVEMLEVEAGETIDFIVDIGNVLNTDQYLWTATLSEQDGDRWNSKSDFTQNLVQLLDPWEQLAQTLLCSNEFLFVD